MRTTSRYDRFGNELMAGGSVTERPGEGEEPPVDRWVAITSGVVVLGLFVWLAVASMWMFVFAVGIVASVFLHETGHFVTARMTGMKATQFFLGFGPRLWSFRRGETEYGVRALPLGAFVRIIGMNNMDEVPPADEARTYRQQTYPRRMLVITAGSLMHLLIALALLFGVYAVRGELVEQPGALIEVQANGPADVAGLRDGDVVVAIDGARVDSSEQLGEAVRSHRPADVVPIVVERDGERLTIETGLGTNTDESSPTFGSALLGVRSGTSVEWEEMSLGDAAASSVTDLFPNAWQSAKGVVQVLNPINIWEHLTDAEGANPATRPTTVVGVTQVSDRFGADFGVGGILLLLASLNVFVGVFNMFPLLPLDGGHAAIATYERVRERDGRRYFADVSRLLPFTMGVIVVLLALFVSGLYLDVTRGFG